MATDGPYHQPALVRDRQADLDAELVGFPGFALADALDFRGVQRVQLVLCRPVAGQGPTIPGDGAAQPLEERGERFASLSRGALPGMRRLRESAGRRTGRPTA